MNNLLSGVWPFLRTFLGMIVLFFSSFSEGKTKRREPPFVEVFSLTSTEALPQPPRYPRFGKFALDPDTEDRAKLILPLLPFSVCFVFFVFFFWGGRFCVSFNFWISLVCFFWEDGFKPLVVGPSKWDYI